MKTKIEIDIDPAVGQPFIRISNIPQDIGCIEDELVKWFLERAHDSGATIKVYFTSTGDALLQPTGDRFIFEQLRNYFHDSSEIQDKIDEIEGIQLRTLNTEVDFSALQL